MAETTAGPAGCLLKGVAVAGAILGIVTGIIKVTEYIKSPTSGVVAQVSLSPFELPQSVLEFRKKVENAADFAAIEKSLNLPSGDAMQKALIAHSVATYLRNVLPGYGTQSISDARSLWFAEVKNVGTITCQSTTITLPGADAVKIEKEGKKVSYLREAEVVELGDLKPQEVVKVTAWASGFTDEDKLKIVYASGIGTIQYLKPGDPFWNWFGENWGDLFFGIFIILFFMLIITGAIVLKRRGSKQVAPTS